MDSIPQIWSATVDKKGYSIYINDVFLIGIGREPDAPTCDIRTNIQRCNTKLAEMRARFDNLGSPIRLYVQGSEDN